MKIIDRCNTSVNKRDDLVHGVIQDMKPTKGVWKFNKLDHKNDVYQYREVKVDAKYMEDLLNETVSLGSEILKLSQTIHSQR